MPTLLRVITFEISFCQFALRYGLSAAHDCATDARLDGHPYQVVVISDHGVPIVDTAGVLLGTLCHFDVVPQRLPDSEFALRVPAARVLSLASIHAVRHETR